MRILVLAQEVGENAPGILYERLLKALPDSVQWTLFPVHYPRMKYWFRRAMVSLFGRDVVARWQCRKLRGIRPGDYDAVLSLCSNDRFWSLEAGLFLKRRLELPWAAYFVDAIPAPEAWQPESAYRRAVVRLVRRSVPKMAFLATLCPEMLSYQLSLTGDVPRTAVLLPPVHSGKMVSLPDRPAGVYRFVYAGRIYGRRSAAHLLAAFGQLRAEVPGAELVFLGTGPDIPSGPGITSLPWVPDPVPYFASSTALIDLDAEVEHDVFLSSKLFSYLPHPRPIICETGEDSPSRHLFHGAQSLLFCAHEAHELKEAMLRTIKEFDTFNYEDRLPVLEQALDVNVGSRLARELALLCP